MGLTQSTARNNNKANATTRVKYTSTRCTSNESGKIQCTVKTTLGGQKASLKNWTPWDPWLNNDDTINIFHKDSNNDNANNTNNANNANNNNKSKKKKKAAKKTAKKTAKKKNNASMGLRKKGRKGLLAHI